jgi:hypothetical protein
MHLPERLGAWASGLAAEPPSLPSGNGVSPASSVFRLPSPKRALEGRCSKRSSGVSTLLDYFNRFFGKSPSLWYPTLTAPSPSDLPSDVRAFIAAFF